MKTKITKMKHYLFMTTATLKEKDLKTYWLDSSLIESFKVHSESIDAALLAYADMLSDRYQVDVSKTAIKRKHGMYIDTESGKTIQLGYVINGRYSLVGADGRLVNKNIDLWIDIKEIAIPDFGKHA